MSSETKSEGFVKASGDGLGLVLWEGNGSYYNAVSVIRISVRMIVHRVCDQVHKLSGTQVIFKFSTHTHTQAVARSRQRICTFVERMTHAHSVITKCNCHSLERTVDAKPNWRSNPLTPTHQLATPTLQTFDHGSAIFRSIATEVDMRRGSHHERIIVGKRVARCVCFAANYHLLGARVESFVFQC